MTTLGEHIIDYPEKLGKVRLRFKPKRVVIRRRHMPSKLIDDSAGERAHPVLFWLIFIVLAAICFGLFRILFLLGETAFVLPPDKGLVLADGVRLEPVEFLPLYALLAFGLQRVLRRVRPAGFGYGFADFLISVVPVAIVGIGVLSWLGLFDFAPYKVPPPERTHYALMAMLWFGIGAVLDIVFNSFKPRTSATPETVEPEGVADVEVEPSSHSTRTPRVLRVVGDKSRETLIMDIGSTHVEPVPDGHDLKITKQTATRYFMEPVKREESAA